MSVIAGQIQRFLLAARHVAAVDPATGRTRLAGPGKVQIQTVDRCNGACVMCPHRLPPGATGLRLMDDSLYALILDQFAAAGTVRDFVLMLQNEPFLDPGLPDRVRRARRALGSRTALRVVTNGTMLTDEAIGALRHCGIDELQISIDAATPEIYGRIRPGFDLGSVRANAVRATERLSGVRVTVRFLRQRLNEGEDANFAAYWKQRGVTVLWTDMNNRAGTLDSFASNARRGLMRPRKMLTKLRARFVAPCFQPFESMFVRHDGTVIVCCSDWSEANAAGNLALSPLPDVWNGPVLNQYRANLKAGHARRNPLCRGCSALDQPRNQSFAEGAAAVKIFSTTSSS